MPAKYYARTGLDYRSKVDGAHIRVEEGEEVLDLAPSALNTEVLAGNIEVVEDQAEAPAPDEPEQDGEPK